MPRPTSLPAELDIYHVAELRAQWLELLAKPAKRGKGGKINPALDCQLDGAAVDQVDGAGLQLLQSLANGLEAQQRRLHIANPSQPLQSACEALGLGHLVALGAQGASA
ncbi:MAG: STAS domain-containing protein [Pseudomonadota bacterium]